MAPQRSDVRTVKIACRCGKRLNLPTSHVGKPGACPACKRILRIIAHSGGAAIRQVRGQLLIQHGPQRVGEHIFLAGSQPIEVGKRAENDLHLTGDMVSRRHCRFVPTDGGWRIEDCNSTNGLFVNGMRVAQHELKSGDRIRVGDYELKYAGVRRKGAPTAAAPAQTEPTQPEPAATEAPAPSADPPPLQGLLGEVEPAEQDLGDEGLLKIGDDVAGAIELAPPPTTPAPIEADEGDEEAPVCPACGTQLAKRAKICVQCGIDVRTGRALVTSQETNLDQIYMAAEGLIRAVSWIIWLGFYPIASEAFGTRKPYVIRGLTILTVITSLLFLGYEWKGSEKMRTLKNYMLWAGEGEPTPELIFVFYAFTNYGDSEAFSRELSEYEAAYPELSDEERMVEAHKALSPEQQYQGQYNRSQLITHAFLHGGILHLVGNMIFLLVFGSRVNALIGNILTILLYPILAVGAALVHMASMAPTEPPTPMLGASGAIMGLAGLYLVLFPTPQVHMAAWIRLGLLGAFKLGLKMWSVRGFWVVLFYIAFDVFYTAMGIDDGTAHWAHLGGFGVGAGIGLIFLLTRTINARGGDLISAMLGKHAWSLVGRPSTEPGILQKLP